MLLPPDDLPDYFRYLESLMRFVQRDMLPQGKKGPKPKPYQKQPVQRRFEIHKHFGAEPGRIVAAYVEANPDRLSEAELAEIAAWKDAVAGRLVFFRQLKKHLIVIEADANPRVFGVLGLTQPFEDLVTQPFPAIVETMILPFRGHLVSDGLISTYSVFIGPGIRKGLEDSYRAAKATGAVLESFGPPKTSAQAPPKKRAARKAPPNPLKGLVGRLRKRFREIRAERARLRQFENEVVPFFETWLNSRFKKERKEVLRLEEEIDELEATIADFRRGLLGEDEESAREAVEEILARAKSGKPLNPKGAEGEGEEADEAPLEEPPEEFVRTLFDEFLWQARGVSSFELDEEEAERAYEEFRKSFEHVREGNRAAFERSLLSIGADRSKENLDAVNKAYRRLAKRLHPDKNPDHGEEAKELWERLRNAKEALDLASIESVEMEWRLLCNEEFAAEDEPRLRSFQEKLRAESGQLGDIRRDLMDHPMWGLEPRTPPKAVEQRIRAEILEELEELRDCREELIEELEALRQSKGGFSRRGGVRFPFSFPFEPRTGPPRKKTRKESSDQMEFPF
jgi:hypothetical protein